MAAGEKPGGQKGGRVVNTAKGGGAQHTGGLINLLKDGLKDGNVEAQEYALWSLSNIAESVASWRSGDAEAIVTAGVIQPLIRTLVEGRLSEVAQEHAAWVLSGLAAALGTNAKVRL